MVDCCDRRTGTSAGRPEPQEEEGFVTAALASPLTAADRCDRCGAQAYVRVTLNGGAELLFCAHHGRVHADALRRVATEVQDESDRLTDAQGSAAPAEDR
jgi:hypothetical protein